MNYRRITNAIEPLKKEIEDYKSPTVLILFLL